MRVRRARAMEELPDLGQIAYLVMQVWEGMPIRRPVFWLQHIPVMYPRVTLEVQEPQLSLCKIRTML